MQPKLLKTGVSEYEQAPFDGENKSGLQSIGEKVLIMIDQVGEKTKGGITLTHEMRDRQNMAAETGIIAAIGDDAFTWSADKSRPWGGYRPKVGDCVYIERYSGALFPGDDGMAYRVLDDRCIGAVRHNQIVKN